VSAVGWTVWFVSCRQSTICELEAHRAFNTVVMYVYVIGSGDKFEFRASNVVQALQLDVDNVANSSGRDLHFKISHAWPCWMDRSVGSMRAIGLLIRCPMGRRHRLYWLISISPQLGLQMKPSRKRSLMSYFVGLPCAFFDVARTEQDLAVLERLPGMGCSSLCCKRDVSY